MASVTGMTVAKLEQELDEMVIGIRLDGGHLIYERRDGSEEDAGELTSADLAVAAAYPISSIYTSTVPANPSDNSLLGFGTWVRFGKGRVLVSQDETQTEFDASGETGGSKTHTLTAAEMPSHSHSISHTHTGSTDTAPNHTHGIAARRSTNTQDTGAETRIQAVGGYGDNTGGIFGNGTTDLGGTHSHIIVTGGPSTGSSGSAGSGAAHNNMPPYIVVYMWQRTA